MACISSLMIISSSVFGVVLIFMCGCWRVSGVCVDPDFSLYRDMPLAVQLHNVFRSRLIGAFWQRHGLRVIPTLQWSTPESFDFVFDGLPERSTVAVSTVGVLTDPVATALWRLGMSEALERLRPNLVLLYGLPMPDFDWRGTEWIRYENKTIERMQHEDAGLAQAAEAETPSHRVA
jgi:hypothetical protein